MNLYNSLQFDNDSECKKQMIKTVSRNIRNIRLKKNLTQEQVAEMAGINPKYLGEIERCEKKNPSMFIISRLSEALKVPTCAILPTNCPHINDYFLAKVRDLSTGKEDSERQKAMGLLEVFFE